MSWSKSGPVSQPNSESMCIDWCAHDGPGKCPSVSDSFTRLGRNVEVWLPKKPCVWSSNEWTGSEDAPSLEYYEHNVDNLALEVVGQDWSSEVISLLVEDWEVGRVALSCHLSMDL